MEMRSVVVTLGPPLEKPWWWDEIKADEELCDLEYQRVVFRKKTAQQISTRELVPFLLHMLPVYLRMRRRFDYVFTFECDLTTFALAFWQKLLFQRRPRHVVLQFIMREKTTALSSRLKYAAMQWCFSSLHRVICSARREAEYYQAVFQWPCGRAAFVPFHTSRTLLEPGEVFDEGFVLAAGRSFRDYPTLLAALGTDGPRAIVVAPRRAVSAPPEVKTLEVLEEISLPELDRLIRRARIVVVPLFDTNVSSGQLVLLHAMALGKPVIATRTSGTEDYIESFVNGVLVPPSDPDALRKAIDRLMLDVRLRKELGDRAREAVRRRHLPHHYTQAVRDVLKNGNGVAVTRQAAY
jgi:glycosyltransferase involved in cell wall biosynthesis